MHDITKHDAEQEWKRNCSEHARIDFFVAGDAVGINDLLKWIDELVLPEEGWFDQAFDVLRTFFEL
jgi:hypothetical protein